MAVHLDLVLGDRQRLAGGDLQLPFDEVHPRDQLGDRVLDLQPGVHLQEVEVPVGVEEELDRPRALVANRLRGGHAGGSHLFAQLRVDRRARSLLDHLLVAALDRAVALAEVDRVAFAVGEDLDLHVARCDHRALEQERVVAEGPGRLAARRFDRRRQRGLVLDEPHSLAAAAGRRLDHQREADLARLFDQQRVVLLLTAVAGHRRHAGTLHQPLGGSLVSHCGDRLGRGADEDDPGVGAGLGEGCVLGEKAVAGVDRAGSGLPCSLDDLPAVEVGLGCRRRADLHGHVGCGNVRRVGVGLGVDGDGAQPHLAGAADYPAGDLAAVGHEDRVEGLGHQIRPTPKETGLTLRLSPSSAIASPKPSTRRLSRGSIMPSSIWRPEVTKADSWAE